MNRLHLAPAPSSPRIDLALQTVRYCLNTLTTTKDLSPRAPNIHIAMAALEGICCAPYTDVEANQIIGILKLTGELHTLRTLLADGETADEYFHARQLIKTSNDAPDLPQRLNSEYARMVKSEIALMLQNCNVTPTTKAAFVGCGALPLTAIYINHFSGIHVTALDCHACCVGIGHFVKGQFKAEHVDVKRAWGEKYDYSNTDIIYVAAMVPNKRQVFAQIARTNPNATVLTRGGAGLRRLFYAAVDVKALEADGWNCIAIAPPPEGVKNTSYVFKRR